MSLMRMAGIQRVEPVAPLRKREEMPEDYLPVRVHFATEEDVQEFARLAGVRITPRTKVVCWPAEAHGGVLASAARERE